ncbi:MAG: nickel-dependent lactate racemase [Candidatus Latescibacteria bacterium]|jgi:lactate racemase|nr:nickel-dependent lactate racemase [Candidatus Latescibacterota bacterium]
MKVDIAYGREGLTIDVPERNLLKILRMAEKPVSADPYGETLKSLASPTGTPPLAEIARGKSSACIVVSDITRPVPNSKIVPPIIQVLEDAGIPSENITILIATGIHRPNEGEELVTVLGEELPKKYRVVNHMSREADTHEYLGKTPHYKAPIYMDKTFLAADLRIATGLIEPHLMAGYSGGRKAVVPGISSFETLKVLHGAESMAYEKNVEGVIEGNLFHEEALYVARLTRVDFIVNVTLNERREITGIFAGDLNEAHIEGVEFMKTQCMDTVDEPVDAVITTSAGYPLDLTFYQAIKGMTAAQGILKKGGILIIAAKIEEGIGSPEFTKLILETESVEEFLESIKKPDSLVLDQWQFQKFCYVLENHEVWLYSDGIDRETQKKLFVTPLESIEDGIKKVKARFGENAAIAVIPEGPYVHAGVS